MAQIFYDPKKKEVTAVYIRCKTDPTTRTSRGEVEATVPDKPKPRIGAKIILKDGIVKLKEN